MSDETESARLESEHRLTTSGQPNSNGVSEYVAPSAVPAFFAAAGSQASFRFVEFFTANIRNVNTRAAYHRSVCQFANWCAARGMEMVDLNPVLIAAYIEELQHSRPEPSVKQALAAIRMLFDWFVIGHVMP